MVVPQISTPSADHFLVGKPPMVVGETQHFRKPPHTPPKFNIAPEKWWLEDEFPFGLPTFRGYVKFQGSMTSWKTTGHHITFGQLCPWSPRRLKGGGDWPPGWSILSLSKRLGATKDRPLVWVLKGPGVWTKGRGWNPGKPLRISRDDWGRLGKIRGITTPPLRILLTWEDTVQNWPFRTFGLQIHRVKPFSGVFPKWKHLQGVSCEMVVKSEFFKNGFWVTHNVAGGGEFPMVHGSCCWTFRWLQVSRFFCGINPRICFKLFHTFHKSAFCWTAGLLPTEVRKIHDFLIHGWISKMMIYIVV